MGNTRKPTRSFYMGILCLVLGFVALRTPPVDGALSLTVAPILLILGYVVLIPRGLLPRQEKMGKIWSISRDSFPVWGVFAGAFIVYILTMYPAPAWWSSPDYIIGSYTLGILAPPGSVLLQLFGRLAGYASFIPSPTVRIHILTAIVTALSAAIVYVLLVRILSTFNHACPFLVQAASIIAALCFAFTTCIWRHGTFTNPYAFSLLMATILTFVAFRWWESSEQPGAGNYLLLAAFLFGLDISVHRSNLLFLPAFLLLVLLRRPRVLLDYRIWAGGIVLFLLGASLQLTNLFRAQLHPVFNLGNPDTFKSLWDYLTLHQFGIKTFGSDLLQRKGPFWDWQVKHEYLRYFGWNFIGFDAATENVKLTGMFGIPVIVGLVGMIYHFVRKTKQALWLLGMFLCASFIAIVYLNVPEPFFRNMERHFLASFMVFSLWLGVGCYAVLNATTRLLPRYADSIWFASAGLFVLLPLNALHANWSSNNQSHNYGCLAYARNILDSCEKNAVLFTGGDIDTFPLWYLQIVENYRNDVAVLNLPLLNTVWFLQTTMRYRPALPWSLTPDSLKNLRVVPWKSKEVTFAGGGSKNSVTVTITPTIADKYLLIQDKVLLNILAHNQWRRPLYTTTNRILHGDLESLLRLDGLVWKIEPDSAKREDYHPLEDNLLRRYDYRGFEGRRFLSRTEKDIAQNYREAFQILLQRLDVNGATAQRDSVKQLYDRLWR